MKKPLFIGVTILFCQSLFAQTTVFEDHFDSYNLSQGIAQQSPVWASSAGPNGGGVSDALASTAYANSPNNSMYISNNRDMFYKFSNGLTSGKYAIEFNALFVDQGYFNVQHAYQTNWAFDLYMTADHKIKYLNVPGGASNCVIIGEYEHDVWINFEMVIDMDMDSVWFYKNDTLLYQTQFHTSTQAGNSNQLSAVNFYGLSGFNGVNTSNFYIDDFKITNLADVTGIHQKSSVSVMIYPNPTSNDLTLSAHENMKLVQLINGTGSVVFEQPLYSTLEHLSLEQFESGWYYVVIETDEGAFTQPICIQR